MAKRYLLYLADADLEESDVRELARVLEKRHGKVKLIAVRGNLRAVIVKTNAQGAAEIRDRSGKIRVSEKLFATMLTSGGIGKLKRRAAESETSVNGEVPQ